MTALFGSGASTIDAACRSGHTQVAEYVLRTGHAPEDPLGQAAVVPQSASANWEWAGVTRMTRTADQPADLEHLATLLSTLHRMQTPFCLRLRHDEALGVTAMIGLLSVELVDWARRLLAPEVILDELDGELPRIAAARVAVRFRAAPRRNAPAGGAEGIGLLDRVAAAASAASDVVIICTPADRIDLERGLLDVGKLHASASCHLTTTTVVDESTHSQTTNSAVQRVADWLDALLDRLAEMRDVGGWLTTITVQGRDVPAAWQLASAVSAAGPSPRSEATPNWIADTFSVNTADSSSHPAESATSLLSSREVASWLQPPRATRAGLEVGPPLPPDRKSVVTDREIWFGNWVGTAEPARLDIDDLAGHVFVAGVTGSGKTTTVLRLLLTAWNRHHVPFLVVDPVKGDYEVLADLVTGGLTLVRGRDLRFNVLEPVAGFDHAMHLDYVAAAFKGAFSMPSPVPYVTSLLFDRIRERADRDQASTLHDVRRLVGPIVRELGYRGELQANILASLGVRLSVLCAPERARRLCSSGSISTLFERPAVVSLADIGDDEERAFIMSALTIYATEHAKLRGPCSGVAHLTVLEEAHRIVAEPRTNGSSEDSGDAAGHASRLITALLAEIRSYGESLVVLDQSPSVVARDVVRNTNTKIVHRVLDPADRELVGGAIGLDIEATAFMSQLAPGEAVVSSRRLSRPQMIKSGSPLRSSTSRAPRGLARTVSNPCCGDDDVLHQRALFLADEAGVVITRALSAALIRDQRESAGVARFVTRELDQIAARARHAVRTACLREVGVRVALECWQNEGWLPRVEQIELRTAVTKMLAADARGVQRDSLPPVPVPRVRPFRGCASCLHACAVRPVGRTEPHLVQIRQDVGRAAPSQVAGVISSWRRRVSASLIDVLGAAGADDAARCSVLHALDGDIEPELVPGAVR